MWSLNHWTTREVPVIVILSFLFYNANIVPYLSMVLMIMSSLSAVFFCLLVFLIIFCWKLDMSYWMIEIIHTENESVWRFMFIWLRVVLWLIFFVASGARGSKFLVLVSSLDFYVFLLGESICLADLSAVPTVLLEPCDAVLRYARQKAFYNLPIKSAH